MPDHSAQFLVLRGGAVGDFVLTLPALKAIRDAWPKGSLEIAGYPQIASLAVSSGLADKVVSIDQAGMARLFGHASQLGPDLVEYIGSFDVVISYLYDPDELVKDNLEAAGARQVISISPVVGSGHAQDWFAEPLSRLAIFPEPGPLRLDVAEEDRAVGASFLNQARLKHPVVIHPGSGGADKAWPMDRYLEAAQRLQHEGCEVLFVIGEADSEQALRLQDWEFPVAANLPLVHLAGLLTCCRGYLGNDSGISHLAGAAGLPGLVLFGPTDPKAWAPKGMAFLASDDGTMQSLSAETVWDALMNSLDSSGEFEGEGP